MKPTDDSLPPHDASELGADPATSAAEQSRRHFLKLMGASLGLAGMTGCIRMPEEKLMPYARRPNNRTPGAPVSYATAMERGGIAQGLLVTSYDGRPIKIEGNPSHPLNRGAADVFAQASILELYDPDRSRGVIHRNPDGTRSQSSWEEFFRWAKGVFTGDGRGIAVLSEPSLSPSLVEMRKRFQKLLPKSVWFDYDPHVPEECQTLWGWVSAPDLSRAKVVVSLGSDLFGSNPLAVKYSREFAAGRQLSRADGGQMNRLYVIESTYTITGACADHRLAVRPSDIGKCAAYIAAALGETNLTDGKSEVTAEQKRFLDVVIADLKANGSQSIVVGDRRQSVLFENLDYLTDWINKQLKSPSGNLSYHSSGLADKDNSGHLPVLSTLASQMASGEVQTLLILGGNPIYSTPANLKFAESLSKVKNTIHLALHDDETSQLCQWHLSKAHYLESWGDARTFDGTVSIVQPLIEPLFDGRSAIEVLARLTDDKEGIDGGGLAVVRRTFKSLVGDKYSEWQWKKALAEGVVEGTQQTVTFVGPNAVVAIDDSKQQVDNSRGLTAPGASQATSSTEETNRGLLAPGYPQKGNGALPNSKAFDLVFFPDAKVYDGRFANNGWLQEFPDPITRMTWGNAAWMNEKTAENIGLKHNEMVSLKAQDTPEVEFPTCIVPGMADGVIGLPLGYGRTAAGAIGNGVGQNAYLLRTSEYLGWRPGVAARPTGKTCALATVQEHHVIDKVGQRAIAQRIPELIHEGTFAEYQHDPSLGHEKSYPVSIFQEHPLDGTPVNRDPVAPNAPAHTFHRWGMAVDLTACTGCGACVVACQAENNIPIVGREQVLLGREMHWLRVDRYFRDGERSGESVHQPVFCMHCETAPCEQVCPFSATTHSTEGINMMTYNRCAGTRYCSNNCPYKVRRFNYFDYNAGTLKDLYMPNLMRQPISELVRMQKNPDVTVRMRGVMEKCTYCIQRIEQARIAAKREADRPIRDGEIQTACQQTCPTGAIVFGDLNDPNSRVSKLHAQQRSYGLLNPELNTKPRTRYLAKVRNPAPGLEETNKTDKHHT